MVILLVTSKQRVLVVLVGTIVVDLGDMGRGDDTGGVGGDVLSISGDAGRACGAGGDRRLDLTRNSHVLLIGNTIGGRVVRHGSTSQGSAGVRGS